MIKESLKICQTDQCNREVECRGWCKTHYQRFYGNKTLQHRISARKCTSNYQKTEKGRRNHLTSCKRYNSTEKGKLTSKKSTINNSKTEARLTYLIAYRQTETRKIYKKFHSAKRRAAKIHASIGHHWDNELLKLYSECPIGYDVDHIIPFLHKDVCGLHVPWNLQHITAEANRFKSNKFDFTYENNSHLIPLET